ncbi:phenylalanine--tRNA ligase beta subunit-related protein [Sinorhizobium sp. CCBAU 05631]|uniref:B3/B4 domain-containing protein n=1 Tax=Sinorhizobium sp. CCBAU 05631 TaxID=794846 RepID=UPI0004B1D2BF|nr:phenylalanine--tRNA ligase beta subunit-related protein [Sinorhizobium sp. CCBAU 05631]ASY59039.1 hypothetical protein SS05631_c41360 [Sinorhizobium sp. CCBAU 05631]
MHFRHSTDIWTEFPELAAGVLHVEGIHRDVPVAAHATEFEAVAKARLAEAAEGDLPEIQAWRRAFSRMGMKPTASEALLRRFRKEGTLPKIHPLIDLCNAASLAFAIPIAVFDLDKVAAHLEVRHADGDEVYMTFAGDIEHPEPREVIFTDAEKRAHARRWTNRQSGYSAVRDETKRVLVVAEALHAGAAADVKRLTDELGAAIRTVWSVEPRCAILGRTAPRLDC